MNIHCLEDKSGLVVAIAKSEKSLPKIKGATHKAITLTVGQKIMLDDGAPLRCFLTKEQRAAWWKANPPKALSFASETKAREEELAAQRAKIIEEERAAIEKRKPKKKAIPTQGKIDYSKMRWDTRKARFVEDKFMALANKRKNAATPEKVKVKVDVKTIEQQFGVKEGSYRQLLLRALVANMAKMTSIEDLAKAVYGSKKKAGACVMVMKGLLMTIEKHDLPWGIDKAENNYQLHEA